MYEIGEHLKPSTRRIAVVTLLSVVIFLTKTIVPSPIDKTFIVAQALLLALGSLLLRRMGATYVAVIGGILTVLLRPALAPFTLSFAFLYGLFVDSFFLIFKVNTDEGMVKTGRLVVSMTLSTGLIGIISYYASVLLELLPRNLVLEVSILAFGTFSGAIAGYLTSTIWNKYLKNAKL